MSLLLSCTAIYPSGCHTARSPLWNQPPCNAFFVASGSRKYYQTVSLNQLYAVLRAYLFQNYISSHDNLTNRLPVFWDINQLLVEILFSFFRLEYNTNGFRCEEPKPLSGEVPCPLLQRKGIPMRLRICFGKRSVTLPNVSL